ncbi:MAG: RICIN domain-containing protein [Prevotella sp.]|nr:RICIN domain-containing protein [Prevotella sp.]
MNKVKILFVGLSLVATSVAAQTTDRVSSSIYLQPVSEAEVNVPFRLSDEGIKLPIRWGMDTAWNSSGNVRRGINHIGKENLTMARGCFRTDAALVGDTALTSSQRNMVRARMNNINLISDTCDIILNSDQEAGVDDYYCSNNNADIDHWVATIAATTKYIQENYPKHKVIALSPFNEPDYTPWNQGSKSDFKEIARLLKEQFPDIAISAGNTLNCDQAQSWYNAVKPYVDWGNTHQLAGSFDTYANFFSLVSSDGNYPYADELHNVGEAMVGAEYGMKAGIWWGFDSRARGEFCRISNNGSRIGYAENRSKWTAASVYRDDEAGGAKAFVGSSERQANTSSFQFISTDRDVYFEGEGPQRTFFMQIPGGTGYQSGQTNAERVINIDYGADVPPTAITAGQYKIMNMASKLVVAVNSSNICQQRYTGATTQQWNIEKVDERIGGDYSFYKITNCRNGYYMNVNNHSTSVANIISYNANNDINEQWYLEYAGDGSYFIRNRESGLYLEIETYSSQQNINIRQNYLATDAKSLLRQMWRILPLDVECETDAPATPTGLTAEGQLASVVLQWTANTEADLAGYMILRAVKGTDDWNTIARKVATTAYIDNTCRQGIDYEYRIKAIDLSENQSEPTISVEVCTSKEKGLVACWDFEENMQDLSENGFDAVEGTSGTYITQYASGSYSYRFDGSSSFIQLPYEVGNSDELTVTGWIYWQSNTNANQRFFDFGNGSNKYMYLTPSAGRYMTFVMSDGENTQSLEYSGARVPLRQWKHLAVSVAEGRVALFLDGEEVASSSDFDLKPTDLELVLNYLGRAQNSSVSKFRGYMDDVRIFNYALSADEVKAVMADVVDGISTVSADSESNATNVLYDLQGRRIPTATRGIVIRQNADGKGEKIIVK